MEDSWGDRPYGVGLAADFVEGANISDQVITDSLHIFQGLYHWRTEVDCEVRAVIISPCMPAFLPIILVGLLVIDEWWNSDLAEVVEVIVVGIGYCTWLQVLLVFVLGGRCREGCFEGEEKDEGKKGTCRVLAAQHASKGGSHKIGDKVL